MRTSIRLWSLLLLAALFSPPPVRAQNPDPVNRLIDRIVGREQEFLQRMKQHKPILETYIQEMPGGADAPPANDHYMIGRLELADGVSYIPFAASAGFQRRGGLFARSGFWFTAEGFAQMTVPDAFEFNRQTYGVEYVRREFLGDLRCLVFDVSPMNKKAAGKFIGRIWVEDQDHRIVRFNGTYTLSKASSVFFHFDSWRVEVEPGLHVPAFIYVEDASPMGQGGGKVRLKAQSRLWGYRGAGSSKWEELTNILIESSSPVRDQSGSKDVSPVESQRSWRRQAAENVIQRLEKSGLLAPKGEVDKVLDTVVNNLMVTNQMDLDVECRVLLTTPLETFSLGRTIVISRGLLDVLPDEASLAVVLSDELAHIVLGHRTDTMYAFGDQTMFAERETLNRLRFSRTPQEIEAANKKAIEVLANSPYKERLSNAGLFLKTLASRGPQLPNLIQGNLGNRLASGSNLVRLAELAAKAPALDETKLEQIAALPLGSRVRLNPWTNQITLIKTQPIALLSPWEKMPFEVTPFVIHLTRLGKATADERRLLVRRPICVYLRFICCSVFYTLGR
jgi:hypothetical protein